MCFQFASDDSHDCTFTATTFKRNRQSRRNYTKLFIGFRTWKNKRIASKITFVCWLKSECLDEYNLYIHVSIVIVKCLSIYFFFLFLKPDHLKIQFIRYADMQKGNVVLSKSRRKIEKKRKMMFIFTNN